MPYFKRVEPADPPSPSPHPHQNPHPHTEPARRIAIRHECGNLQAQLLFDFNYLKQPEDYEKSINDTDGLLEIETEVSGYFGYGRTNFVLETNPPPPHTHPTLPLTQHSPLTHATHSSKKTT